MEESFFETTWRLFKILMSGAGTTLTLFIIVILASIPLGFLITLMATSKNVISKGFAKGYIFVLRGTPLLLQILVVYVGLPKIPEIGPYLILDGFTSAIIAFILNYAAYFAEIFRGGLLSIDKGQYEAAQVLGLNKFQTFIHIIIPQMLRVSLPSVSNETITLVKDTSLLYAVAIPEILHYAKAQVVSSASLYPFVIAALIYLILTLVLTLFFRWFEKKYKRTNNGNKSLKRRYQ